MQLTDTIKARLQKKEILLMTHLVLGYPSLEANRQVIRQMVENGVDLIEMQIPFSEPMADGPVIAQANQEALSTGIKVRECIEFASEIIKEYDIPFLFMTYYNILYKFGVEEFVSQAAELGITGLIIPDLPPEEGKVYLEATAKHGLAPIMIYAPTSTEARMKTLASHGDGFIYCVARKGVTGAKTSFDQEFDDYMATCRKAAGDLPLAVGFGISQKADLDYLTGKADIAVIGSATIRLVEEKGVDAVGEFIAGLF